MVSPRSITQMWQRAMKRSLRKSMRHTQCSQIGRYGRSMMLIRSQRKVTLVPLDIRHGQQEHPRQAEEVLLDIVALQILNVSNNSNTTSSSTEVKEIRILVVPGRIQASRSRLFGSLWGRGTTVRHMTLVPHQETIRITFHNSNTLATHQITTATFTMTIHAGRVLLRSSSTKKWEQQSVKSHEFDRPANKNSAGVSRSTKSTQDNKESESVL